MHSASALLTAAVLGASGGVRGKFLLAGLGEGGWGGPSQLRTPRRARLQPPDFAATRGLSSPQVPAPAPTGWADPCTAPCHPLPHPRPLPRLRRAPAPASSAPPAPGSLQSLRLPPAPSSGAPASFQPGERLGGERGTAREAETGALGTPALPVWEAARTPGAGTQGKARTGRPAEGRAPLIIHAGHVWGHPAAFSSFSPFAFSPFPVGEGKVAVAAPCPGRSESRGRKWRTSR